MSSTFFSTLIQGIQTRFNSEVSLATGEVITYDNLGDDKSTKPTDDKAHVHVVINFGDSRQVTFGASSNRHRLNGVMTAMVFVPVSKGKARAYEIADLIKVAFQSRLVSNVRYRTVALQRVGPSGKYWQLNVVCPFEADDLV